MLSSFINRRKVKKISLFDAALRRAPSLETQSDQENPRSKHWGSLSKASVPGVTSLRGHRQSSPKVHLDFTPSGSNDWFPQEILAPQDDDGHIPLQPVPDSTTSAMYDDVVVIGPDRVSVILSSPALRLSPSKSPLKSKPSPALPPLPVNGGLSSIESGHDV